MSPSKKINPCNEDEYPCVFSMEVYAFDENGNQATADVTFGGKGIPTHEHIMEMIGKFEDKLPDGFQLATRKEFHKVRTDAVAPLSSLLSLALPTLKGAWYGRKGE